MVGYFSASRHGSRTSRERLCGRAGLVVTGGMVTISFADACLLISHGRAQLRTFLEVGMAGAPCVDDCAVVSALSSPEVWTPSRLRGRAFVEHARSCMVAYFSASRHGSRTSRERLCGRAGLVVTGGIDTIPPARAHCRCTRSGHDGDHRCVHAKGERTVVRWSLGTHCLPPSLRLRGHGRPCPSAVPTCTARERRERLAHTAFPVALCGGDPTTPRFGRRCRGSLSGWRRDYFLWPCQ